MLLREKGISVPEKATIADLKRSSSSGRSILYVGTGHRIARAEADSGAAFAISMPGIAQQAHTRR
eukprot:2144693-Rhodomonas_salina.3